MDSSVGEPDVPIDDGGELLPGVFWDHASFVLFGPQGLA
jgi:hypothetical protein